MASKGGSEDIKTPEQQNETRRTIKKARRARQRAGQLSVPAQGTDLMSQIRQDQIAAAKERINQQGVTLLDQLGPLICSSSPTANSELHDALIILVVTYTSTTNETLRESGQRRLDYAIAAALEGISSQPTRDYFASTAKKVRLR